MMEFIVKERESGLTIDKYLKLYLTDVNISFLHMVLRKKQVKVNGTHIKDLKLVLNQGDKVTVYLPEQTKKKVEPSFIIAYEDDDMLIIDKDPGVLAHPVNKKDKFTLLEQATNYLMAKQEYIPAIMEYRPAFSNRLDQYTSGLIIMAKNKEASQRINKMIQERVIKKYYLAIVKGKMPNYEGEFRDYIYIDDEKGFVTIDKQKKVDGKLIITKYKVIEVNNEDSVIEVELETGRLHQIRAHLAFNHHPILGDPKYGDLLWNQKRQVNHQLLHAYKLVFSDGLEVKSKREIGK